MDFNIDPNICFKTFKKYWISPQKTFQKHVISKKTITWTSKKDWTSSFFNRSLPSEILWINLDQLGSSSARPVCSWWIGTTPAADSRSLGRRKPMNVRRGRVGGNSQVNTGMIFWHKHGMMWDSIHNELCRMVWDEHWMNMGWFGMNVNLMIWYDLG